MIVQCSHCDMFFEDEYRSYVCPHQAIVANDGNNNFSVHEDAYLNEEPLVGGDLRISK